MKHLFFIVSQAGQAAYCAPLWDKWQKSVQKQSFDFHVIAHPQAQNLLKRDWPHIKISSFSNLNDTPALCDLLSGYDVAAVVTSACGRTWEVAASNYAAAHKHISHIQIIDSWFNYASRVRRSNAPGVLPDTVCVIDEDAKIETVRDALPANIIECTGHPQWEVAMQQPNKVLPRDKVVFASQPLSELPDMMGIGFNEIDVWKYLCQFAETYPNLVEELIYLPHPSQSHRPAFFPDYARLASKNGNPLDMCGTLVSMFSAIMVEACLKNMHVIGLQPGLKQPNICPLQKKGYVPHVINYNMDDLYTAFTGDCGAHIEKLKTIVFNSTDRLERVILKTLE